MSDSSKNKIGNNRVWIIEDNTSYRETIALVINQSSDFRCTKQFNDWEKASELLSETVQPDIILSDIGLPGMSGIEGAALAHKKTPDVPIIMLTVHDEDDKIFDAICAGASVYLLKSATATEIIEALQQALKGGSPMNTHIARKILEMFAQMNTTEEHYNLTDREIEILRLIIDGITKKAIALELDISFHTVDSHVRHIYKKLQVTCRSDAVAKAIREKLV
jgi:DNA-binding NarL/FixJ family response regulator